MKQFFDGHRCGLLSSCVAKRYLIQSQDHVSQLQADSTALQNRVYSFRTRSPQWKNIADQNKKIAELSSQNTRRTTNSRTTKPADQSKRDLIKNNNAFNNWNLR